MGDLLVQIAHRDAIKRMLDQLSGTEDDLVRRIVDDLERILEMRVLDQPPSSAAPESPPQTDERAGSQRDEIPPPEHVGFPLNEYTEEEAARASSIFSRIVEPEPSADQEEPPREAPEEQRPDEKEGGEQSRTTPTEHAAGSQESEVPLIKQHQVRIPFELDDDDWVYFHGVTSIPLEDMSSPKPFMLEEKGMDNREFAFALDRGGLRFYLSRVIPGSLNVAKTGMVLLNKQESIRLRGVHAGILNDLRAHGIVLPIEFGTVAAGKDNLLSKIDDHLFDLQEAMDDQLETTWWTVSVYMLDARLVQVVGTDKTPVRPERERERVSFRTVPQQVRIDIKTLERILGKQKKIAETIHNELTAVADRSELETIVGFGSGTSDDWKQILKASYEIPGQRVGQLNRALTEIQYRHLLFDLMLTLTGNREFFSFQRT